MNSAFNVFSFLESAAEHSPHKGAIIQGGDAISYQQLRDASVSLSEELYTAGVTHGAVVAPQLRNGAHFIAALFAILRCGAIAAPLSPQLHPAERRERIEDLAIDFVINEMDDPTVDTPAPSARVFGNECLIVATGRARDQQTSTPHVKDAACIRPTSGTTAKSKGVILSHTQIRERVIAAEAGLALTEDDSIIWVLPMAFHFVASILLYVYARARIVICEDSLAETIVKAIENHDGTILYASPTHYQLLAGCENTAPLQKLRLAISTTGGMPSETLTIFDSVIGKEIRQVYGIIEGGLPIGNLSTTPAPGASIGKPLPGYDVRILNEQGNTCTSDEPGELCFRGPGMFDAYLNPPQARETILQDGWFHTGDIARRDELGNIFIVGRKKSVINVAGHKVFPEEVEACLLTHPSVGRCRVSGRKHPLIGEMLTAEIVLVDGHELREASLRKHCSSSLSRFKIPHEFVQTDSIPLTQSGKIQRHEKSAQTPR